ncbi:MAG: GGDEF domain-containing protein [Microthrixaceae bacterium]|nr:GGDEF domain-containing protein [Microthrixaceae bacterium]
MVFGDLDGFKTLNDRLGHRTGGAVLVAVAQGLRVGAGEGATIGRIGGDEFVAVRMVRGPSEAMNLMTRCRSAVSESLAEFPGVDISLGVALSEVGGQRSGPVAPRGCGHVHREAT